MEIGIYRFINIVNNKSYIGQSVNIKRRLQDHKKRYQYVDNKFYRALRKYGFENFSFEIVELCKFEELNEKEIFYIQYYDAYYNGYNSTLGGSNGTLMVLTEEGLQSLIHDLKETQLDYQSLNDKYGISIQNISLINQGKVNIRPNENYPLRKIPNRAKNRRDPKSMTGKLNINAKAVTGINTKTQEVIYFDTRADAARYLLEKEITKANLRAIETSIYKVIHGLRKTAYGFVWKNTNPD